MLLSTIAEKHPNSFVLLLPKTRDEQNHVRDWQVLNTSRHYDEILKVAKYHIGIAAQHTTPRFALYSKQTI